MGKIVGIDLGTTYSAVVVFNEREGRYVTVPSSEGTPTVPSVVAYKGGQVIVGHQAKAGYAADPDNVVIQIKRHMGEPALDAEKRPILRDGQPVPYSVTFAGKPHSPELISAYVLKHLKELAEGYLQEPVTGAVITVPAYFTGGPRRATEEAGRLAGLDVKCLLNEPTAAAIAFGVGARRADAEEDSPDPRPRKILVYDLGGGTFDVSIIAVSAEKIDVLSTDGDHYLGGVDFDRAIIDWVLGKIREDHGVDLEHPAGVDPATATAYKHAYTRVFNEAEKTKIALSTSNSTTLQLPFLFPGKSGMVNLEYEIYRNDFLMLIRKKLSSTIDTVDRALKAANLAKEDIDDVLLVGGSSKIPRIRELLEKHFGRPPRKDVNPDECVAHGAAIQALSYVDVKELSPAAVAQVEATPEIFDITGHSLGVREGEDNMSVIIPKNTRIPAVAEQTYQTGADFQKQVSVIVYQGEDKVASQNTKLIEFDLTGLEPLPAGQVRIKIRFELDINGVLNIQTKELLHDNAVAVDTKYGGATTASPDDLVRLKPADTRNGKGAQGQNGAVPPAMEETVKRARAALSTLDGARKLRLDGALAAYLDALRRGDASACDEQAEALQNTYYDCTE